MTPKLRFPWFTDEWQVKKLGDIFEYKSTNSLSRAELGDTGSVSNIHYGDIHKSLPTHLDSQKYTLPKILNDSNVIKGDSIEVGDIIIADASEDYDDIGKSIELVAKKPNEDIRSGLHTFLMSPKEDTAVGYYGIALKSANVRRQFRRIATGISVLGVSKNNVSKIDIAIPSKPEQEKIADFLTAVDERIAVGEKKLELLETYKSGVMQKIFSQKIRFRDENGNDYPEWSNGILGHLINISMGQSPSSSAYNDSGDGVPLIQGNADIKNRRTKPRFWTTEVTKTCDRGDIILTVRAPSGYVALSSHQACIGRGVCAIKASGNSLIEYLYQYLLWFEPKWISVEQGSTFTAISGEDIKGLKVKIPRLEEQQKIATFLTALDARIAAEKSKLAATRQFKKALLQRMFV